MNLPLGKILSEDFQVAFRNLAAIPFPSYQTNRQIAKSFRQMKEAVDAYSKARVAILSEHGKNVGDDRFEVSPDKGIIVRTKLEALADEPVELALVENLILPPGANLCGRDLFELADFLADMEPESPLHVLPEPQKA